MAEVRIQLSRVIHPANTRQACTFTSTSLVEHFGAIQGMPVHTIPSPISMSKISLGPSIPHTLHLPGISTHCALIAWPSAVPFAPLPANVDTSIVSLFQSRVAFCMVWYGMVWYVRNYKVHNTCKPYQRETKIKLEPSVATGRIDGSTPMVWYGV